MKQTRLDQVIAALTGEADLDTELELQHPDSQLSRDMQHVRHIADTALHSPRFTTEIIRGLDNESDSSDN